MHTYTYIALALYPAALALLGVLAAYVLAYYHDRTLTAPIEGRMADADTWMVDVEWDLIVATPGPRTAAPLARRAPRRGSVPRFGYRAPTGSSARYVPELEAAGRMGARAPSGGKRPRGRDPPGAVPPNRQAPRPDPSGKATRCRETSYLIALSFCPKKILKISATET